MQQMSYVSNNKLVGAETLFYKKDHIWAVRNGLKSNDRNHYYGQLTTQYRN